MPGSTGASAMSELLGRLLRTRQGAVGAAILLLVALACLVGPYLAPYDPEQLDFLGRHARRELSQFFIHGQFDGGCNVAFEGDEAAVARDQRPQFRVFHGQFTELVLARDDAGVGEKSADFLESLVEFLEFAPDGVFHGAEL